MRRLSFDSAARRGWDRCPVVPRCSFDSATVLLSRKASFEKNLILRRPNSSSSPNQKLSTIRKSFSEKDIVVKQPPSPRISTRKHVVLKKAYSEDSILKHPISNIISPLKQEVMSTRNARFLAAIYALQVTSATEVVLQCMSTFSELCDSSEKNSVFPLVEDFLNLHQSILRAATAINTLLNMKLPEEGNAYYSQYPLSEMCEKVMDKNATSWVQAAVGTNLSKFDLFSKEDNEVNVNAEKCHYVVLKTSSKKVEAENNSPDMKRSPGNQDAPISGSRPKMSPYNSRQHLSTTTKTITAKELKPTGNGLLQVASLSAKLLLQSRAWFLNYLDESLNKGFGLQNGEGDSEIGSLLGQLKRVNQWLDNSFPEENGTNERIAGLKKKIYGFLLDYVDSAIIRR